MRTRPRRERSAAACLCSLAAVLALACQPPSSTAAALEDTPENRASQVDRYFVAQPPEQMLHDMVENLSAGMPEDQRARFIDVMTKQLDVAKLNSVMRESMAKHFTADELRSLADFYGSPLGKSAMAKFGNYMTEVMPTIQAEIVAAVGRAQGELAPQPAETPAPEPPKG